MKENIQYLFFWVWLISYNMMTSSSIYFLYGWKKLHCQLIPNEAALSNICWIHSRKPSVGCCFLHSFLWMLWWFWPMVGCHSLLSPIFCWTAEEWILSCSFSGGKSNLQMADWVDGTFLQWEKLGSLYTFMPHHLPLPSLMNSGNEIIK